jgi:endothelin-converting enzyme/putative endopeptidase
MALAALRQKNGGQVDAKTEQDFFVAFAQTWCTNYRPEAARLQALNNPHSTAQWRVNGPVSDNPEFAKAWSCKAGSAMAPPNRCTVW